MADGRVAWSSCQLRQWELQRNNANDSLLLLWLGTTGLRNILYAGETHVPSQMTTTDHYTALALISPSLSTRSSTHNPLTLSALSRLDTKQFFMLSICFWGLLTGNKKNVVTNLRVGLHSCLKRFTRVSNRYNSGLLSTWFKDSWAAPTLHLHSAENKVNTVSALLQSNSHWRYSAGHRFFFETILQEQQHQPFEQVPRNTLC